MKAELESTTAQLAEAEAEAEELGAKLEETTRATEQQQVGKTSLGKIPLSNTVLWCSNRSQQKYKPCKMPLSRHSKSRWRR